MRKIHRKKNEIRCPDCGRWYINRRVKAGPCPSCKQQRDLIHALHYGNQEPMTADQEAEERLRVKTHRCHAPS